jgi:hypothetical protein
MNNCLFCEHCRRTSDDDEWGLYFYYYFECTAIRGRDNLSSFPFKRTKCTLFSRRDVPLSNRIEKRSFPDNLR